MAIVICVAIGWSEPAYAYLDPSSGSMMLQGILAGIGAGLGAIGYYWRRLKGFFRRDKRDRADDETDARR